MAEQEVDVERTRYVRTCREGEGVAVGESLITIERLREGDVRVVVRAPKHVVLKPIQTDRELNQPDGVACRVAEPDGS